MNKLSSTKSYSSTESSAVHRNESTDSEVKAAEWVHRCWRCGGEHKPQPETVDIITVRQLAILQADVKLFNLATILLPSLLIALALRSNP